jgi:hypothetical protein
MDQNRAGGRTNLIVQPNDPEENKEEENLDDERISDERPYEPSNSDIIERENNT